MQTKFRLIKQSWSRILRWFSFNFSTHCAAHIFAKSNQFLFSGYIASSLTYPFTVVSHCNIVSRSGLAAGYPPNMPLHYNNWFDIWKQLSRDNQLKRGSSLLFRKYTGPQVVIGNRAIPLDPRMKSEMKLN